MNDLNSPSQEDMEGDFEWELLMNYIKELEQKVKVLEDGKRRKVQTKDNRPKD